MTHRGAVLTIGSPTHPADACPGALVRISSGFVTRPGGVRHQDVYICRRCRSRVALCDGKYLFTDRGNTLEAEGPIQGIGSW